MQLGMIGLGRMGANIVRRLMRNGHSCVVYDRNPEPGRQLAADGATAVADLAGLVAALQAPRRIWLMLPAGPVTEATLGELVRPALARRHAHRRRQRLLEGRHPPRRRTEGKGLHYLDVGTSGGVWGLERGYCLMIGGQKAVVDPSTRSSPRWRRARATSPRTPGRGGRSPRRAGLPAAGPSGAGHFVKMIHNGIEYGMMQAIAEGFDILQQRRLPRLPAELACPRRRRVAEVWRRGSVITSWLLDLTSSALA